MRNAVGVETASVITIPWGKSENLDLNTLKNVRSNLVKQRFIKKKKSSQSAHDKGVSRVSEEEFLSNEGK